MTELDSQTWFPPPTHTHCTYLFKPKFHCLSHRGSLVQLVVDVLMDAQRSMVEGSFPNGASSKSEPYKPAFQATAYLGWEDMTLLKAAAKRDLLQVKEVLTNSLARPETACLQAGMSGLDMLWRGRQEPSSAQVTLCRVWTLI